ncbi:hypothetical protein [Ectopseudomonas toyotomiensis]|uniref:hypothetical protein n=1 Tax=Ectopseudomonas toyotomiensis TaxID=554344 RepID=UPI003D0CD990
MLADQNLSSACAGLLSKNIQFGRPQRSGLLDFVAAALIQWRNDDDRPEKTSETDLTSQFCSYLNTAARQSTWDFLQFKVEEPDETTPGRKVDLVANPCGSIVWASGRRCTHYDTLLPIECKRLPTPKGTERDEREYVTAGKKTVGGMQRFKWGYHAANHELAGMIAFVQADNLDAWLERINQWIFDLAMDNTSGWQRDDIVYPLLSHSSVGLGTYSSRHLRAAGTHIEIRHMWIEMSRREATSH